MKRMWRVLVCAGFVAFVSVVVAVPAGRVAAAGEIGAGVEGKSCVMGTSRSSLTHVADATSTPFTFGFKCFVNSTSSGFDAVITEISQMASSGTLTGFGGSNVSIANASAWGAADFGTYNSGAGNRSFTFTRGQMRDRFGAAVGTAIDSNLPDNYFELLVTLGTTSTFAGYVGPSAWVPSVAHSGSGSTWQLGSPTLTTCRQAAVSPGSQGCVSSGPTTSRPTDKYIPTFASITTTGAATWSAAEPDHFIPGGGFYHLPTCSELGVSYEYREAGVDSDWVDAVDGEFPSLDFGDSIRASVTLGTDEQIDHFAVFQSNDTPVKHTGDYPNYRDYHLEGFSTQLISPLDGSHPTELTEQVESGIGVSWFIAPGDGLSQIVGPYTHEFAWTYLGVSGTVPEFLVQCHVYGQAHPFEVLLPDGTGYTGGVSTNSGTACEESSATWKASLSTDTQWGFQIRKPASTTELQEIHWRYIPTDMFVPGSWTDITPGTLPEDGDYTATLLIDKADAPAPLLVQWKFVCSVAGGGTEDVETRTNAPGNGTGVDAQESCYGKALDSMELTRPSSWVSGAGRMGVCLVEFLFVPDDEFLETMVTSAVESTEDTLPFSMVYEAFAIFDTFFDAAEEADGGVVDTGMDCELLVGSPACSGSTIDTPDLLTGANRDIVWGVICLSLTMLALSFAWTMVHWDSGSSAEGKS